VQRQSHQRGARQQHQQQQAQSQTGNKPADDFSHTKYFTPNLTNPARHSVSTLVCTPKMSHYDFGRRRNSDQSDPANRAPFRKVCHHEGLGEAR
jgi:hypothetical protein